MKHFLTDMSNRVEHQKLIQVAAELPPGWVFGVQLGFRQTQALIKKITIRRGKVPLAILVFSCKLLLKSNIAGGTFLLIVLALISACVCRRPSWTPKTQPGGSSAVTWLSFWCSTRLLMSVKKCLGYRGKTFSDDANKCDRLVVFRFKLGFRQMQLKNQHLSYNHHYILDSQKGTSSYSRMHWTGTVNASRMYEWW